jgi:hypothetical protein
MELSNRSDSWAVTRALFPRDMLQARLGRGPSLKVEIELYAQIYEVRELMGGPEKRIHKDGGHVPKVPRAERRGPKRALPLVSGCAYYIFPFPWEVLSHALISWPSGHMETWMADRQRAWRERDNKSAASSVWSRGLLADAIHAWVHLPLYQPATTLRPRPGSLCGGVDGAARFKPSTAAAAPALLARLQLLSVSVPGSPTRLAALLLPMALSTEQLKASLAPTFSPAPLVSNWAETYFCTPLGIYRPQSEAQVQQVVELAKREKKALRVIGACHSPSDLMCLGEEGYLVSLDNLNKFISVRWSSNHPDLMS